MATNYALGTLGGDPYDTKGIMELGGDSAQVPFMLSVLYVFSCVNFRLVILRLRLFHFHITYLSLVNVMFSIKIVKKSVVIYLELSNSRI